MDHIAPACPRREFRNMHVCAIIYLITCILYYACMFTLRRMQCTAMFFWYLKSPKRQGIPSCLLEYFLFCMHTSRINCYFCSLAVKDGVLAGSPCMMPMVPLRLRVCRIHYWNSARLCCLQLVLPLWRIRNQWKWIKFSASTVSMEVPTTILWENSRNSLSEMVYHGLILCVHLFIPFLCISTCQVSLGPSAPLQVGQRGGSPWKRSFFHRRLALEAAMPEILTSVPNGCRWHKDVLAALEVHHGNPPLRGCVVLLFPVQASAKCCVQRCKGIPGLEVAAEPEGSMHLGWRENGHQIGHGRTAVLFPWEWVVIHCCGVSYLGVSDQEYIYIYVYVYP